MNVEIKHIYKSFRNGVYLGLIPNVKSDFNYDQDLNTSGTTTQIDVIQSLDTSTDDVVPLETEDGQPLTTEDGQVLTTEGGSQLIGVKDSGTLMANYNDIEIWEFSDYNPNGKLVFTGYQSNWVVDTTNGVVSLTVISYGKDMIDYIYGNNAYILELSQATTNGDIALSSPGYRIGQTFTTGVAQTAIARIGVKLANISQTRSYTCRLWHSKEEAVSGASPMGIVTIMPTLPLYPTLTETNFSFSDSITVLPSTSYFFDVTIDTGVVFGDSTTYGDIAVSTSNPYAGGIVYYAPSGTTWNNFAADDLWFKIYSGTILTDASFSSYDPATMVTDSITGYNAQGGLVTYTGSSIDLTGYSLDYDFITASVLEIVQKAKELSPSDWYWYVDPATQILSFKEALTTATHNFILGRHITDLPSVGATIEYIVNTIYFTGGPTAAVNLLKKYTDTASLLVNRLGMQKVSDNRILAANEPTAKAQSNAFMAENSTEVFTAESITISAQAYDIASIHLGETVSIKGFGNFLDTIIFQITRIKRGGSYITLYLGKLPLRSDSYVDKLKNDLENQQTLDNPNTPS